MVVAELARLGFFDPRDIIHWGPQGLRLKDSSNLSDDNVRALAQIRVTPTTHGRATSVKFADRLRALEMLGRHLGLFSERSEVSGQARGPMRIIEANEVKREEVGTD